MKVGDIVQLHYDGYYLPKSFKSCYARIEKINRKLIEVSSTSFIGVYKVGVNNIIELKKNIINLNSMAFRDWLDFKNIKWTRDENATIIFGDIDLFSLGFEYSQYIIKQNDKN